MQHSSLQHSSLQHSSLQHSSLQHSSLQHSSLQHSFSSLMIKPPFENEKTYQNRQFGALCVKNGLPIIGKKKGCQAQKIARPSSKIIHKKAP
ncbi:MAG: hypothetical protein ACI4VB_00480 [Bradymonadia bacterium]